MGVGEQIREVEKSDNQFGNIGLKKHDTVEFRKNSWEPKYRATNMKE